MSVIKNLIVAVPSLPEQQKIATFLSSIDEKISHSSAQIEKMETWKKGLLQQMFV
ncbi:MAG: restriction endonuclease subunit S [Ignavibacterium sp.]|nr:restriction endonuclease subunit S [Ignavibacterium sp.]